MKTTFAIGLIAILLIGIATALPLTATYGYTVATAGDFSCSDTAKKTLSTMQEQHPDKYVMLGDLSYSKKGETCFINYLSPISKEQIILDVGNHDSPEEGCKTCTKQINQFTGQKSYYQTNNSDNTVAFFNVDTQQSLKKGSKQFNWLSDGLKNSKAWYKIVDFHKAEVSCKCKHAPVGHFKDLQILFAKYHVDIVLQGHNHNYQRFTPVDNVTWIVIGTGGQKSYALKQPPTGMPVTLRAFSGAAGFLWLNMTTVNQADHHITGNFIANDNTIRDTFVIPS